MRARNIPAGELNRYIYTQCYDRLCAAVSAALGRPVSAVIHRHQISIEADEGSVWYAFAAWVEYDKDTEDGEQYRLRVRLDFDGSSCGLFLEEADLWSDSLERLPRRGIQTDQCLIPALYRNSLREAEAERFLSRYCPEALREPMRVPIRIIMEERMGLRLNLDVCPPDGAFGQVMYRDGVIPVIDADGKEHLLSCRRGDVLADGDRGVLLGFGALNYTLAHEAYHWYAHRACMDFHALAGKAEENSYNGTSAYSAPDILEIQANAMASRILMPQKTFLRKNSEYAGMEDTERIAALASFFAVSYTAATIRLAQLGLGDYSAREETCFVAPGDAFGLYFSDNSFRERVDAEEIVYTDRRYVYNRPEYVAKVWEEVPKYGSPGSPYRLTEYALAHPEEAFVFFRIHRGRVIRHGDDYLQARSDESLKIQVENLRRHFPEEAEEMKEHAQRFERMLRKVKDRRTFCEAAREMICYRYSLVSEEADEKQEAPTQVEWFCSDTLQPRQYFEKIMKGTAGQPDNRTLMSLCAGMHLSAGKARDLFTAAGRALSRTRTDMAYRYILLHLRDRYIEDINIFLDELGLELLGAKKNNI